MENGIRYDDGKERYDLFAPHAMGELARVYTFGCVKYAPRNWEKGLSWSRTFAAIMRHAWAWMRGEVFDRETGLHHMAHAAWGCLALVEFHYAHKGEDDRPYSNEVKNATANQP